MQTLILTIIGFYVVALFFQYVDHIEQEKRISRQKRRES